METKNLPGFLHMHAHSPEEIPEEFRNKMLECVRNNGYSVLGCRADLEGKVYNFVHSVGLCSKGWPEILLVAALPMHIAVALILKTVQQWEVREAPFTGLIDQLLGTKDTDYPCYLSAITQANLESKATRAVDIFFPDTPYRVVQLVVPDYKGCLPSNLNYCGEEVDQYLFPTLQ